MVYILRNRSRFSPIVATGGTITSYTLNNVVYRVHSFTSVGTTNFVVSGLGSNPFVEYLIVAGGGGGGDGRGGGGGAGGFITNGLTISQTSHTVVVGAGGASRARGGNSSVFGVTAIGGGYGGTHVAENNGVSGGSGGGASMNYSSVQPLGGAGTAGQGSSGGNSQGAINNPRNTGGGGGAGGAGISGNGGNLAGTVGTRPNGGAGLSSSLRTGAAVFYAGGGGGARGIGPGETAYNSAPLGLGQAGGGNGQDIHNSINSTSAVANSGSGGGGSTGGGGKAGGSGIVIIRYPLTNPG